MARGRGCSIHWSIYRGGSTQKTYLLHLRSKQKEKKNKFKVLVFSVFLRVATIHFELKGRHVAIKFKR